MKVTIYHNPSCSKSRRTLELIRERGHEPEIIEYLKSPPDEETLNDLLNKLDLAPRELMRRNETPFRELGLDDPSIERAALIRAMVAFPVLIERPIVVSEGRARLGRPPEQVLEIL